LSYQDNQTMLVLVWLREVGVWRGSDRASFLHMAVLFRDWLLLGWK